MKATKTNIVLFIGLLLVYASSCTHDSLPTYEDVDRIYFAWARPVIPQGSDETKVNLGYDNPVKNDSVIHVEVLLMGRVSDKDRPIAAEVIKAESSAIQGQDIEILPSVIPAGEVGGFLGIKVKNSGRLETTTLMGRIRLLPNEYFHVDFTTAYNAPTKSGLEYNVYFDAKADMPSLWADPESGAMLTMYFGVFSNVKLQLICDVCGLTRDFFMHDPATQKAKDVLDARIPSEVSYGIVAQVNRYLDQYYTEHGVSLTDENGYVIKMGSTFK
ncbi:hypothetical protein FACS1894179_00610 [Bacteroidia bacterium]|nr:hypothetical protein FACS1894169_15800 [Bacteroidia bacterium]GHV38011.1 hypothetical protein FACS1894179_00610 [Bacteroidia bacterium]